jgi:hypothetical protein
MSDKDIFEITPKDDKTLEETIPNLDVFADKLMAIKNADGSPKYTTLEKALDALKASQDHIPVLENDNKSLKEKVEALTAEANRVKELEEIVRRMTNGNQNNEEKPQGVTPQNGGLSADDAAKLVRDILSQEKQVDTAKQNITTVQTKLVEKYGDKVQEVLKAKAAELGTSLDKLKELSATSPAMVLALFGDVSSSSSPTTTSIRINGIKQPDTTVQRPEKSIISGPGATDKNRIELMRKIKEEVYRKHGVTA